MMERETMTIPQKVPELLAPAGDMEALRCAVQFGADAVYLAGTRFGMRSAPRNFTLDELREAVRFAHENGVRVYLTCNTLPRNYELQEIEAFIPEAATCGIDAFIATDLGVLRMLRRLAPQTEIHISTQAGVTNYASANVLYEMGARRIIPAREISLAEIAEIKRNIPPDMDVECFIHGAICVSFSGRCLLSNYMTNRDSNRGECAQPCRWTYNLVEERRPGEFYPLGEDEDGSYILNARDMCMIRHIPELVEAGVSSFKIEGRAKSNYYVSVVVNAYRCAIDGYLKNPSPDYVPEQWILDEVYKVSHREYCTGFFFGHPKDNAEIFYDQIYRRYCETVAEVLSYDGTYLHLRQRNKFCVGDEIEFLEPGKPPVTFKVPELLTEEGESVEAVPHPMMLFKMPMEKAVVPGSIVRRSTGELLEI